MPIVAWLLLAALLSASDAFAHARSVSYSSFAIDDAGADVTLRIALLELSRLGPGALPIDLESGTDPSTSAATSAAASAATASADARTLAFTDELVLAVAGQRCLPVGSIRRSVDRAGFARFAWRVACPTQSGELTIESRVLHDVAPSHLHFARVRFAAEEGAVHERVLTEAAKRFVVRPNASDPDAPASPHGSRFIDYVELGVLHILSGWDHLAFLFGLILLAERLGTIARLVTGFTLAHSLTLALAVAGLVHPRAAAVEAVIAFSVALVAAEKGWLVAGRPRSVALGIVALLALLAVPALAGSEAPPTLSLQTLAGLALFTLCYFGLAERTAWAGARLALTFAFGLVHGFGFAGILVELALPADRLVPALAGFNLGVELGHLGCLLAAWPLLVFAGRRTSEAGRRWARDLAVAGLAGLGTFWLFERGFAF